MLVKYIDSSNDNISIANKGYDQFFCDSFFGGSAGPSTLNNWNVDGIRRVRPLEDLRCGR